MYQYIEQFYNNYKTVLVNGEMRPVVSYNKDAEEYINKLVKIYEDNGKPVEITLAQIEQGLNVGSGSNVATVESPLTWLSLNLIEDTDDGKTKKDPLHTYLFTEEFLLLADNKMAPGVHILNKLYQIDSLLNVSKFTNLLICTLREGYLKGCIIDFPRENQKYLERVKDTVQRANYSQRINEVYGYPYDLNSSPHASMRAINNLIKLELIKRNGSTPEGFYKYELTENAHRLLSTINANIERCGNDESSMRGELPKEPLQLITYGAPGTGKSFNIEKDIAKYHMKDVRTTFHPDSDYSTFVGAYKPQMQKERKCVILDKEEKEIKPSVTKQEYESKIVYKYSKQAFLKSYVEAWKDIKNPHVLVIEEMNRGNCAQIFGDIFQLLDRNDAGFSRYPIDADADVMQELNEEFEGLTLEDADAINALYKDDVVDYIISGEKLVLPNNLYIWATMNTSDQSLFPIDSAFKRRWSQRYVPISDAGKGWVISVNGNEYDWWSFVSLINSKIWDATHSEDKKLGYFFCQANTEGVISAKDFVGKVIFFIYNDVFKDNDFDDKLFVDETDPENPDLLFKDFFMPDGNPNEKKLDVFMQNLGVAPKTIPGEDENLQEIQVDSEEAPLGETPAKSLKVVFEDETIEDDTIIATYIHALKKIGLEKVEEIASEKTYQRFDCPLVSKERLEPIESDSTFSWEPVDGYFVMKGMNTKSMIRFLTLLSERLGLNLKIEY